MISDGEGLQRDERIEELVERVAQIRARRAGQAAALQVGERHDAEVHEQHLQQVFARHERIGHERRERPSIEMLQHRSNQRRLAGANLAGQDDEPFAAANTGQEFFEGRGVRGTAIEEARVRREAERLLLEAVVRTRRSATARTRRAANVPAGSNDPAWTCRPVSPECRLWQLLTHDVPLAHRRGLVMPAVARRIGENWPTARDRDSGSGTRDPGSGIGFGIRDSGFGIRLTFLGGSWPDRAST